MNNSHYSFFNKSSKKEQVIGITHNTIFENNSFDKNLKELSFDDSDNNEESYSHIDDDTYTIYTDLYEMYYGKYILKFDLKFHERFAK